MKKAKSWKNSILLFVGLLILTTFLFAGNFNKDVEAQGDYPASCLKSLEFSQRNIFARNVDDAFILTPNRFPSNTAEFFAKINPEIPGALSSLEDIKVYGVNNATGADICTLSLNGNLCATFTGSTPIGGYVVSLTSCPNGLSDLNLNAYNTFKMDCTQGGPVTITRVIYESVWNTCA